MVSYYCFNITEVPTCHFLELPFLLFPDPVNRCMLGLHLALPEISKNQIIRARRSHFLQKQKKIENIDARI